MSETLIAAPSKERPRKQEPQHFQYIDALRGWAILAVILIHCAREVPHLARIIWKVSFYGVFGVQLFFVLSAATLLLSYHGRSQEKQNATRNFYIRRFFRIAPLIWAGIFFYHYQNLRPFPQPPVGLTWLQVLATFTFTNGWYPTYLSGIVPGGWSIVAETSFYVVFPLLAAWLTDRKRTLYALCAALVIGSILNRVLFDLMFTSWLGHRQDTLFDFLTLWFPSDLPVFLIGFLLYYRLKAVRALPQDSTLFFLGREMPRRVVALGHVIAAIIFMVLLMHSSLIQNYVIVASRTRALLGAAFAVAFTWLIYGLALVPFRFFVNPLTRYLGLISFSGYLTHFYILAHTKDAINALPLSPSAHFLVLFLSVVLLTTVVSTVTYQCIEKPGIALGRRLIAFLDSRHTRRALPDLAG